MIDNSKNNINNLNIKKKYFPRRRAPVDKKKLSYYLNHLKKGKLKKIQKHNLKKNTKLLHISRNEFISFYLLTLDE